MFFYNIRLLHVDDYYKQYLNLLEDLTIVGNISFDDFQKFVSGLSYNAHSVVVIEDILKKKIIATGTIIIESKIIHEMGKVGHIEDVVVSEEVRGKGFGKYIINDLMSIAKYNSCYKVVLDSTIQSVSFYEKNGFIRKECSMMKYLHLSGDLK